VNLGSTYIEPGARISEVWPMFIYGKTQHATIKSEGTFKIAYQDADMVKTSDER
jgi:hypothetical protein